MTKSELNQLAQAQLAADLGCAPALLDRTENQVFVWQDDPNRRKYGNDRPFLELVIWNGTIFASCDPALLPWAQGYFPKRLAPWLFHPRRFREIDDALALFGYEIGDAHTFYLPCLDCPPARPIAPVRWYESEELEQFRGEERWQEALAFNPLFPDMLAVAALTSFGEPIAMAGASRDGARMWQIGIDVLTARRGKGLGSNLTALLRDEVLRRGAVPFYGTAESHIFSRNVARNAGFYPAFGYLYAKPKGT